MLLSYQDQFRKGLIFFCAAIAPNLHPFLHQ